MAKKNVYQEKTSPALTFLYIVVAIILVIAIIFMYVKDHNRRKQFADMVYDAAASERSVDIASVKMGDASENADLQGEVMPTDIPAETPQPTVEPTAEPTAAPTEKPVPTKNVANTTIEDVSLPENNDTQDGLVDETLSKGLNG